MPITFHSNPPHRLTYKFYNKFVEIDEFYFSHHSLADLRYPLEDTQCFLIPNDYLRSVRDVNYKMWIAHSHLRLLLQE